MHSSRTGRVQQADSLGKMDVTQISELTAMNAEYTEDLLSRLTGPVAIVGNATPKHEFGPLIDAYETVIRINNYRISGYEQKVGAKTTYRCLNAWQDIEFRAGPAEFSPFTAQAAESANLAAFIRGNGRPVPTARQDVHPFIPEMPNPSTGFALVQLCAQLKLPVDLFGFDGFKTAHYWESNPQFSTTHKLGEIDFILQRPGVLLFGETYPYEQLYDFCHQNHAAYDENAGLNLFQRMGWRISGLKVLEYGAGNGQLARFLEQSGNEVTAVEVSRHAFERIVTTHKVHGGTLSLPFLTGSHDLFLCIDVLEHLTENDIKMVIRQAARLCSRLLVSVSTRPSGLLGPKGQNLHLTVQPAAWWTKQFAPYFETRCHPGIGPGQYVIEGERRKAACSAPVVAAPAAQTPFCLKPDYRSRDSIHYFEDNVTETTGVVWQPCVYPFAAEIANYFGCRRLIDVGCGHAGKLVELHAEFQITGIDYGKNIEYCRRQYPFGDWLEADLEKPGKLALDPAWVEHAVVICSDVVEHMLDPGLLAAKLRQLLESAPAVLISTPERDLTHGPRHQGPPPNPAHVREWNLVEFQAFLESQGFAIDFIGVSPSNNDTFEHKTILAVVGHPRTDGVKRYAALWGQTTNPAQARGEYRQALVNCHRNLVKRALEAKTRKPAPPAAKPAPAPTATGAKPGAASPEPVNPQVDAWLKQAGDAYAKGDLATAKKCVSQAEEIAPRSALVLENLGVLAFLSDDFSGALEALQRAQILHPDQPNMLVKIALSALRLDKAELFECALGRALELNPDHPEGLRLLADLNLQQKNYAVAARYFHRLLRQNANAVDNLHSLAFCLFQGKEYEAAATVYERILQLEPANELARENLKVVHQKLPPPAAPALAAMAASIAVMAAPVASAPPQAAPPPFALTAPAASADAPLASIIILAWNQLAHTRACLESLQQHTPEPHEVILVDNGSTDGTPAYLREQARLHPHYTVILNRANRGFAAGNNQGLRLATGKTVLFLNNDTVLTEGWLGRLLAVLEDHAETGIVGPVTNCVSGPQLIAPVAYENLAGLQDFAAQWAEQNEGKSIEINRVVGFCLLARRAVIDRIGGLDEQFGSGNFEDDDFCIRARACGFKARVARAAFIHHAGSQTFKGARIDYTASMRRNWELFKIKYRLPGDALVENGYRLPTPAWSQALFSPLPEVGQDHVFDAEARVWNDVSAASEAGREPSPTARRVEIASEAPPATAPPAALEVPELPMPALPAAEVPSIPLPACALVGRLKTGYDCLRDSDWLGAWKSGLQALKLRPFHPEALVMLGQTAQSAGYLELARQCGQRALQLAPRFDLALNFMAALPAKGKKRKLDWPALPPAREHAHPTLTVCVIAKDEEQFIVQCLNSVRGFAHQIVLVDTGSTDRTVALAKELGAEVYHFEWNDNFSDARNVALEHARGDWILSLDADEELVASEHAKTLEAMKNSEAIGCRMPLVNCGLNEVGGSYVPRLIRNAPGLFFIGRVHEQVFPSVLARAAEWKMRTIVGGGEIHHHGYEAGVMSSRNKVERNLKLLQQAVTEMPGEPHLMMNLGLELTRSNLPEEGLVKYREAFRLMSAQDQRLWVPEMREALLTQYPVSLMALKYYEEAIEVLKSPLAVVAGQTASMHYALGGCYFHLKQFDQVVEHMALCLAKRNEPAHWPLIREVTTVTPRRYLANSLVLTGRYEEAMRNYRQALEEDPKNRALRQDFARFLHQQKQSIEALNLLHELVQEDANDAPAWTLGGLISLSSPDYFEVAMDWTAQAIHHFPEQTELRAQRAEFLLLGQEPGQSLAFWEKIPGSRLEVEMAKLICRLVTGKGPVPPPACAASELELSREFIRWYRRFITWQSVEIVNAINDRLPALNQVLPMAGRAIESAVGTANQDAAEAARFIATN
jgi:GT2 family glycosyltransferase/2-polyprenyl-3-methyl-5-hydroxy-6-metoxy-1,4-benzoquinol methylase/Flp pilus assembly protein TadD